MSDDAFFARFRANTLKWMVKWIRNPMNSQTASTLQKWIPTDKTRDMKGKKLTNAVKLQLIEIERLPINLRKLMRQIVHNTNNLKNTVFIQNVLHASRTNTTHNKTIRNNTIANTKTQSNVEMTAPLIQSYEETDRILSDLKQRTTANTQKLTMLNELSAKESAKQIIINALTESKQQEIGWKLRKQIVMEVIHRIKKKEQKILQSKKTMSLQIIMEKITLSKNKSLCQLTLKLNTINMEYENTKRELMVLCSDTNTNNMDSINALQSKKKEKETEKGIISEKIKAQNALIKGIGLLLNEVINYKEIDIVEWANLSMNIKIELVSNVSNVSDLKQIQTTSVHTFESKAKPTSASVNAINNDIHSRNLSVNNNVMHMRNNGQKKIKRKFKRPTRSNVVKAKTLTVCDILPQKICPVKIINDTLLETSGNIWKDTMERDQWIDEYNKGHIPSIQRKYKSIYGHNIYFKQMQKHRITTVNTEKQRNHDCMNTSEDDTLSATHSQINRESQVLCVPLVDSEDIESNTTRVNKQSLNLNASKVDVFRSQHQTKKRYSYKYDGTIHENHNHPLLMNDPLKRMESNNIENETFGGEFCLHFVARGMCKYLNDGCLYKHPQEYNADRFYCITLNKNGECNQKDCKYIHNWKHIPCSDYYERECHLEECSKSHTFTKKDYDIWSMAKKDRDEAFKKWREINMNRNGKKEMVNSGYSDNCNRGNDTMNDSVTNDDRLNDVLNHQLFDSALAE